MDIDKVFEGMDASKVMVLARGCGTMEELMGKVGLMEDGGEDVILSVNPRVEWWFRACDAGEAVRKSHEVKDLRRMLMSRRRLIRALWEMMKKEKDEALDVEALLAEVEGMDVKDPMEEVEEIEGIEGVEGVEEENRENEGPISQTIFIPMGEGDGEGIHCMESTGEDEGGVDKGERICDDTGFVGEKEPKNGGEMKSKTGEVGERVPLKVGEIDCEVIAKDVIGWTGETYCNRGVVSVLRRPEVFGGVPLKNEAIVNLTLHNGILNHMGIRPDRSPTPYWAVMDAMSDMKGGFTMEQVVSRAMVIMGDDSKMSACKTAWYVLKSHQTHPKERDRGMAFIVETLSPGHFSLRARKEDETQAKFDKDREERMGKRTAKMEENVKTGMKRSRTEKEGSSTEPVILATHVVNEIS